MLPCLFPENGLLPKPLDSPSPGMPPFKPRFSWLRMAARRGEKRGGSIPPPTSLEGGERASGEDRPLTSPLPNNPAFE